MTSTGININVTGAGGESNVGGNANVTGVQGDINVYHGGKIDVEAIHKQTVEDIETYTEHTVETAALHKALEKVADDSPCVTITGAPGEGKSTLAYQLLKTLHREGGRKVYQVSSADQFEEVTKNSDPLTLVLLDDVFGQTLFDKAEWGNWKRPLKRFLDRKERKPRELGNLVLVGRDFVFTSGERTTEDPWKMLMDKKYVVDITQTFASNEDEKLSILKTRLGSLNILNPFIMKEICSIKSPHGFPHACKVFVGLYKESSGLVNKVIDFFKKPLEFLMEALKVLINDNTVIEHIFLEMLKGDGHVTKRELEKRDPVYIRTANDLRTYIKRNKNVYSFDHASILDTVSYLFCETRLSVVIDHCSMDFLTERTWLNTTDGEAINKTQGHTLMWAIDESDMDTLAERFGKEIREGNVVKVTYHNAWESHMFVQMVIELLTPEQMKLVGRDSELGDTLLHVLCRDSRVAFLEMCLDRGANVDGQNRRGFTALHWAAALGHAVCVRVLCERGADVNIKDGWGRTPLDMAKQSGYEAAAAILREHGGKRGRR